MQRGIDIDTSVNNTGVSGLDDLLNDGAEQTGGASSNNVSVVGLTGLDSMMLENSDTESLGKYADRAKETLKEGALPIKVMKLDKEKFGLGFSFVLYSYKSDDSKVYYFLSLLERTGRQPLEVKQIINELNVKNTTAILVTSDAFDDTVYNLTATVLKKAYPDAKELQSLEGTVIPTESDVEVTAEVVTRYVHNRMVVASGIDSGKMSDLTFGALRSISRNSNVNLDIAFNTGLTINTIGRSIRSDFNIESNITSNSNIRSMHDVSGKKKLSTVSGYLEYLVSDKVNEYTGQTTKVATPMLILNEFIGKASSLNYVLTSIVNSTIFSNRPILTNLIIEKDAGPLNLLFNYGGDAGKPGDKLSFKDPKAKPEIINDIIRQHIVQYPIIVVEVEIYGGDYSHMTPFVALTNAETHEAATEDILNGASELVGSQMETRNVLGDETSFVPIGKYQDADGNTRDLREIDLTFICTYSNDQSLVYDWIYSTLTTSMCKSVTGKDPYTLKLEVINKLASMLNFRPVITGKAARIPLSGVFVEELTRKAMAAGYNPVPTNAENIGYNDMNNLQIVSNAYQGAALTNTGFGMYSYNSVNSQMPGAYNSYYRR